jgi:hypothetical protein
MDGRQRGPRGSEGILRALCQAMLPELPELEDAPGRVARRLLEQTRFMPPLMRLMYRLGLYVLDLSPLLLLQARGRLSRLPLQRCRELIGRWHHSRLYARRQIALAYSGTIFFAFYDLPEVRTRLGYRIGEWVEDCKDRREALLEKDRAEGASAPRSASMIRR